MVIVAAKDRAGAGFTAVQVACGQAQRLWRTVLIGYGISALAALSRSFTCITLRSWRQDLAYRGHAAGGRSKPSALGVHRGFSGLGRRSP